MNLSGNKGAILKKITAVLLGIAFSILALELGLRLAGLLFTSFQEYSNRISLSKKGTFRILCLGESTTAGQYPPFLEEILNQNSTGIKFSVIDKGIVGAHTQAILLRLKEHLDKYKPDMVVAMMGYNDRYVMYYKDIPESKTKLFQYSRVYRLIRLIYNHMLHKLKKPKKAIGSKPKDYNAYVGEGIACQRQGRLSKAEELFKKAIELNPKNHLAFRALGELWRDQGKLPEAEKSYKKAIELNPRDNEAYNGLAAVYQIQGKFPEAEKSYKKAMENDPQHHGGYAGLIWLYWKQGRLSQVEETLKEFLEVSPRKDWMYRALENFYREMNKRELAEECKKKRDELGLNEYCPMAVNSYHKLKEILDQRGIRLVCMQYPMRSVEPLKKIFEGEKGVIFVDNEEIFKEAVGKDGYNEYFIDIFGGDFGHCTQKGNRLLAKDIADVILKEVFGR